LCISLFVLIIPNDANCRVSQPPPTLWTLSGILAILLAEPQTRKGQAVFVVPPRYAWFFTTFLLTATIALASRLRWERKKSKNRICKWKLFIQFTQLSSFTLAHSVGCGGLVCTDIFSLHTIMNKTKKLNVLTTTTKWWS